MGFPGTRVLPGDRVQADFGDLGTVKICFEQSDPVGDDMRDELRPL
jgi:hypothetical protein